MVKTNELWFRIAVAVLSLVVAITSIINIIFYNDASQGKCSGISTGFATFMLWMNILLMIFAVGIFIWSIVILLFSKPVPSDNKPAVCPPCFAPGQAPAAPAVVVAPPPQVIVQTPRSQVVGEIQRDITAPSGIYQQREASQFVGGAVEAFSQ